MARESIIPAVSVPTEGSFNNNPTLTLPNPDDVKKPGVCLGVKKIRAVLNHLEECKAFVAKHAKPPKGNEKLIQKLKALGLSDEEIKSTMAEG